MRRVCFRECRWEGLVRRRYVAPERSVAVVSVPAIWCARCVSRNVFMEMSVC